MQLIVREYHVLSLWITVHPYSPPCICMCGILLGNMAQEVLVEITIIRSAIVISNWRRKTHQHTKRAQPLPKKKPPEINVQFPVVDFYAFVHSHDGGPHLAGGLDHGFGLRRSTMTMDIYGPISHVMSPESHPCDNQIQSAGPTGDFQSFSTVFHAARAA